MPNKITSRTVAITSPLAVGVNVTPEISDTANSSTASAGKTHADRGIEACELISPERRYLARFFADFLTLFFAFFTVFFFLTAFFLGAR